MNESGSEDHDAAEEWVMKMLDEPHIYKPGLDRWMAGRPDRRVLFNELMRDVDDASAAAATMPRPGKRSRMSLRWAAALAAGLVGFLAFSIYAIWLSPAEHEPGRPSSPTRAFVLATRVGEMRTVALEDGSSVILDTDTLLTVNFSNGRRSLNLRRGRARFNVAHDRKRPFIVHAGTGEVLATGTIFDVFLDDVVKVTLIEGSVKVAAPVHYGAESVPRNINLKIGQQTSYNASPTLSLVAKPSEPSAGQWIEESRSLDDVAIRDIIAEANRYSEMKIELAEPALGDRRLVAELDIRDIDKVASASAAYLNLDIDRSRPGRIILRQKK